MLTWYVWYPHSMCVFIELYQCLRPHNEIHWVMLTLASRLTNSQSYIKRIKLSTQRWCPQTPCWLQSEVFVMVNEWDGQECSCLSALYLGQGEYASCSPLFSNTLPVWAKVTLQSLIMKTHLYTTRMSIQDKSVKILRKYDGENVFKRRFISSLGDKGTLTSWGFEFPLSGLKRHMKWDEIKPKTSS